MVQIKIIPELHIRDTNLQTRVDYVLEIRSYSERILKGFIEQRNMMGPEDTLIAVFDGDIFDRYMSDLGACLEWIKFFLSLFQITEGHVYSVVGNHEITYKSGNLFWMIADIASPWVESRNFITKDIISFSKLIKVVDELRVEDMLIIMGHYLRDVSQYTDEYVAERFPGTREVVLISHNELLTPEIVADHKAKHRELTMGRNNYNKLHAVGMLPLTSLLTRVYVGHMHQAYGEFEISETWNDVDYHFVISYLASLGRTNVLEVRPDFCERNIPCIFMSDGETEYRKEEFWLAKEDVVVNHEKLVANRERYDSQAEIRSIRSADIVMIDPVKDLQVLLRKDPELVNMFSCALTKQLPVDVFSLLEQTRVMVAQYGKR